PLNTTGARTWTTKTASSIWRTKTASLRCSTKTRRTTTTTTVRTSGKTTTNQTGTNRMHGMTMMMNPVQKEVTLQAEKRSEKSLWMLFMGTSPDLVVGHVLAQRLMESVNDTITTVQVSEDQRVDARWERNGDAWERTI